MQRLRETLIHRPRRSLTGPRRAAVLVPIVEDRAGERLLLTRRTEHLSSHRGQVAFPGGGVEPGDADATDAALREAHEEVGLPPASVEVLGWLDDFPTVTETVIVTPVVGRIRELPALTACPEEVARIFSIPLADLRRREGWRVETATHRGRRWPLYFYEHDGETLWGLSAYITLHLLSLTPEGGPFEIPGV